MLVRPYLRSARLPQPGKRYADVAECYRLLANERQRLIAAGAITSDQPSRTNRLGIN